MRLSAMLAAAALALSAAGAQALPLDRTLDTGTDATIVQGAAAAALARI